MNDAHGPTSDLRPQTSDLGATLRLCDEALPAVLATRVDAVRAAAAGADAIEIGNPFSDPIMNGPMCLSWP